MNRDDSNRRYVSKILTASEGMAETTRSLLAFSRTQNISTSLISAKKIIQVTQNLILHLIGEDIELKVSLTGDPLLVIADPGLLEHVMLNLASNARDAMPHGGRLTIKARQCEVSEEFARNNGLEIAGDYVQISVIDSGTGIDEKIRG